MSLLCSSRSATITATSSASPSALPMRSPIPASLSSLEIQVECAVAAAVGEVGADDPMDTLRHAQIALKRAKLTKAFELYTVGSD